MSETGSIKFTCDRVAVELSQFAGFDELNEYRRKLLDLGMVGVDANGIGFGNLSIRDGATSRFYITGSATAGISELKPSHYARVVAYDFARNWLQCQGSVASSESLTHAAVYESEPAAGAVIHGHDMKLWAALLEEEAPATPKGVEYGTPQMAYAVRDLLMFREDVKRRKIFAMAGHERGVVAFGRDLEEAFGALSREHLRGISG